MKTSSKFILTGIASFMVVTSISAMPAIAELKAVSPSTVAGFPEWYEDSNGLRLDLCLAASIDRTPPGYCLTDPPDSEQPPSVHAEEPAESNFPDEAFWWAAEAQVQTPNIRALLVLATEAAFANEEPIDGDQMVFNRTRIRIQGSALRVNTRYRITYPYGVQTLTATQKDRRKPAEISFNHDFACAVSVTTPCKFDDLLAPGPTRSRNLIGPWLRWPDTSNPADQPPLGYIGDPNVEHVVIGSPVRDVREPKHWTGYQNYFLVEQLDANGRVVGAPIAYTDLFSVSGKLSPVATTNATSTTNTSTTTTTTTTLAPATTVAPAVVVNEPAPAPIEGGGGKGRGRNRGR